MFSANGYPALVLNADFRPLSYFPLSLWSWQEAVKASFLDRVNIVSEYEQAVHSPSFEMNLPSVISLKDYVHLDRRPAFTRFNVFLRDRFTCSYCGTAAATEELTFDHIVPKSRGGKTNWQNVVCSCIPCNVKKGGATPEEARMRLLKRPIRPRWSPLARDISGKPYEDWRPFLSMIDASYWHTELIDL